VELAVKYKPRGLLQAKDLEHNFLCCIVGGDNVGILPPIAKHCNVDTTELEGVERRSKLLFFLHQTRFNPHTLDCFLRSARLKLVLHTPEKHGMIVPRRRDSLVRI